jgi:Ulp1 family protease
MFFPINQSNNHWILIEMDVTTERWNVYDSMSTDASPVGSGKYKDIVDVRFKVSKLFRYYFLIGTSQ